MKTVSILIFCLLLLFSCFYFLFHFRPGLPQKHQIQNIVEEIAPKPTEIIEETQLPDRHLIRTAFIPQSPEKNWDQPWQDACEEASLLNVYFYYQEQKPDIPQMLSAFQKLFDYQQEKKWTHDINLTQMATMSADLWGYQTKIVENPSLDDIKTTISQNIPVIATANGKTLFKENKNFKNGGPWYHSLVILGYDDDQQQFIVHDVGTRLGAYFHYSYQILLESIHDLAPSHKKEDIDQGSSRVLLLLK